MNILSYSISLILVAKGSCYAEAPCPGELYENILRRTELYGRCWFDALQVAKTHCGEQVSSTAIGQVGLMMYNCHLEKSESRRIDCASDEDVAKCEALREEIREKFHRQLFLESRNSFIVFCEQWKQRGRPQVLETFTDGTGASGSPEVVTIYSLARSSMESFLGFSSVVWRWSQSGLDGLLSRLGKYQLQNRLNHACNHCKSSVSQLFASMEIFISNTQRMWKLYLKIVTTNPQRCERDQDDSPSNLVGSMQYLWTAAYFISAIMFICRWNWVRENLLVLYTWTGLLFFEFHFEKKLITYALNNCHGTGESKLVYLDREQNSLRNLFAIASGLILASTALSKLCSPRTMFSNLRRRGQS